MVSHPTGLLAVSIAGLLLAGCGADYRPYGAEKLGGADAAVTFEGQRKLLLNIEGYTREGCSFEITGIRSSPDTWDLKKGGEVIGQVYLEVVEVC